MSRKFGTPPAGWGTGAAGTGTTPPFNLAQVGGATIPAPLGGGSQPLPTQLVDNNGNQVQVGFPGDGTSASLRVLETSAYLLAYNSATLDRLRTLSAPNIGQASGQGGLISAGPGEWIASSAPAVGLQAISTRAAGGGFTSHICRSIQFGFSSQAALAGVTTVTFTLTDGLAVMTWTFDLPAAIIAPFSVAFTGLNYVGGLNNPMGLQSDAAHAGLRVWTNLLGYDAS